MPDSSKRDTAVLMRHPSKMAAAAGVCWRQGGSFTPSSCSSPRAARRLLVDPLAKLFGRPDKGLCSVDVCMQGVTICKAHEAAQVRINSDGSTHFYYTRRIQPPRSQKGIQLSYWRSGCCISTQPRCFISTLIRGQLWRCDGMQCKQLAPYSGAKLRQTVTSDTVFGRVRLTHGIRKPPADSSVT